MITKRRSRGRRTEPGKLCIVTFQFSLVSTQFAWSILLTAKKRRKMYSGLFCDQEYRPRDLSNEIAASHSRVTKPPYRRAKIALGQDKTKDIHNFK